MYIWNHLFGFNYRIIWEINYSKLKTLDNLVQNFIDLT